MESTTNHRLLFFTVNCKVKPAAHTFISLRRYFAQSTAKGRSDGSRCTGWPIDRSDIQMIWQWPDYRSQPPCFFVKNGTALSRLLYTPTTTDSASGWFPSFKYLFIVPCHYSADHPMINHKIRMNRKTHFSMCELQNINRCSGYTCFSSKPDSIIERGLIVGIQILCKNQKKWKTWIWA